MTMIKNDNNLSRRRFIKILGGTAALSLAGCTSAVNSSDKDSQADDKNAGEMTYRVNPKTGEKVSLLGYGCMRYPTVDGTPDSPLDQEVINRSIDYALEHGVNYFDTSPAYCKGESEKATGIALSRHPRDSYFIATKMSNFSPETWSRERSIEIYHNSLKALQTDHIDYMLLHAIGGGEDAMATFNSRFIDNGILDFLVAEREAGRIRNLGFSYHGDIRVFDHLLAQHDKYHWDFVQIQLNYVDWDHAKEINERNTNASYLYDELQKRDIPAVIMEPLLGGRLATLSNSLAAKIKQRRPDDTVASWAFRYAGTPAGVLTVLSGMTYMEHLKDNLRSFSPLDPITQEEDELLQHIAATYVNYPLVPCTDCRYCMPCPYGIDIPGIFGRYNRSVNDGIVPEDTRDPAFAEARRSFLVNYDRAIERRRQADHCISCGKCVTCCPQGIEIPAALRRIDSLVESMRQA